MARRTKSPTIVNKIKTETALDIETLVAKVAAAVGEQMSDKLKDALKDIPAGKVEYRQGKNPGEFEIEIDERIIPMNISAETIEGNLEKIANEETQVDDNLKQAKSKLAALLKKKKEKT